MPQDKIKNSIIVKGARVHNLKNIDVEIPKNKFIVVTGVSGSGKSSLAFDTLYAEGQRRYIESFSSYAQQFLGKMDKPDVDKIEGLPPAISIEGQSASRNPRSTVGTMTEIYDLLRLLFSRIGKPHCPKCGSLISRQSISQIANQIFKLVRGAQVIILAFQEGTPSDTLKNLQEKGFVSARINGRIYKIEEAIGLKFDSNKIFKIEAVIDRFVLNKKDIDRIRIIDSIETALKIGGNVVTIVIVQSGKSRDLIFSDKFICQKCKITFPEIEPRLFSFNSPQGACHDCTGLGFKLEVDPSLVITNPNLSLAEGAIRPWSMIPYRVGGNNPEWQALEKLAVKYNFSLNKPIRSLSQEIIDLILCGKGDYEGIVPNLERRYRETDSEHARLEIEKYMIIKICPTCGGKRLRAEALMVKIAGKNIDEIVSMGIQDCKKFFEDIFKKEFGKDELKIVEPIVKEIIKQLQFLIDVNVEYLSLSRSAPNLSVGEAQRVRLATQIGSKLTGVLYVLDEPSIGLHPRDQERLIMALKNLRDMGNTVLVVEHDEQTIREADWVIDLGPGAGNEGGKIIFKGTPKQFEKSNTLTGKYLSGRLRINAESRKKNIKFLTIKGAKEHNLKNIDVRIPLGVFTCITGVSGSGKSTLMNDILAKVLVKRFNHVRQKPGIHKEIVGLENLDKAVIVDQSPIGRTPRSNPATYTGLFAYIRNLFVETKQAKARGYRAGYFSFNVKGGRCEECQGAGLKKIEMYFLPDNYIKCPECQGKRYNKEILEIKYRGVDISEVLEMTIEEALSFFKGIPALRDKLGILDEVGLGYMKIGQPAPSLSGGEAQRVKLATELSRKSTGKTIYILDEPTTGLHPADIKNLLTVLKKLVEIGNTVLVIEHNLDIIKNADWIIDLGPEGGEKGGYIIAEGRPGEIIKVNQSYTGQWLKKVKKISNF